MARATTPDPPRPVPTPGGPAVRPLPIEQAVLLDGKPFPPRNRAALAAAPAPAPARTLYVSRPKEQKAEPAAAGDGTEALPWTDLQAALRALTPGDRLVVLPGVYSGAFRIDDSCGDGKSKAWIQVEFRKSRLAPSGDPPALWLARKYWRLESLSVAGREGRAAPLVELAAGADHVLLNRAHVDSIGGSGVAIRRGARHVTLAGCNIGGRTKSEPLAEAVAVDVGAGSRDVTLQDDWIVASAGPGIRVGSAAAGQTPPERISIVGTTIRDCRGPAVWVLSADDLRLADSDLLQGLPDRIGSSEGVRIEAGRKLRVERNHVRDFALAFRAGVADPAAAARASGPREVFFERNFVETRTGRGAAVAVETASGVRIANNVFEGVSEAFLVFGRPPSTEKIAVANNLVVGVGDTAFHVDDLSSASFFDANVFSPRSRRTFVENGGSRVELAEYLGSGKMPQTRLARDVRLVNRDLARVRGVDVVDRGKPLEGLKFVGKAPDIGIAEH